MNFIIATNLKQLRKNAGLTQEQASASLNLTRSAYASYEEARAIPPLEIIIAIMDFYTIRDVRVLLAENMIPLSSSLPTNTIEKAYFKLPMKMRTIVDVIFKLNQ